MSRARHKEHKERANGGSIKPDWNAGEEQNVAKEAMEKKKGGRTNHHAEGEEGKKRMDKRARGGHVKHHEEEKERKHGGKMEHEEHKKRARGGRIGSDKMPLSSAAKVKHITKGETPEEGDDMVK